MALFGQYDCSTYKLSEEPSIATIKPLHSRYRVVKGDTLSKISRRNYGDDVYWVDIAHRNHMRKSLLLVGRNLILPNVHPKSHAAGSQHKVVVPFTLLPPPTSDSHTFSWFTQGISPTMATIAADVPEVSIKLKLEKTILTAELPTCKVVVKCTGEVTLTRPNPEAFTDIEMTLGDQPEIAASAKTEFQNAAADITQKGTVSWNPTSGEMEYIKQDHANHQDKWQSVYDAGVRMEGAFDLYLYHSTRSREGPTYRQP